MNRTLLILNIALLTAVAVLVAVVLSGSNKGGGGSKPQVVVQGKTPPAEGFSIAYFDIDSITSNYQFCKDVKQLLERRKEEAEKKMQGLQRNYESRLAVLQQKATSMSPQEMEKARNELATMQQNMMTEKEKAVANFEEERKFKELDIKKNIEEFLAVYNTPRKYSYILADEPGIFYFRDSAYDITQDVLTGLNASYKKKPQ